MIDDDDGDFFLFLGLFESKVFLSIIFLVIALFLYYIANQNDEECKRKHCDSGQPELLEGKCVCVGTPK